MAASIPDQAIWIKDFLLTVQEVRDDDTATGVAKPRPFKMVNGTLEALPLRLLLLDVEDNRRSGVIDVSTPDLSGHITYRAGKPCSAAAGELQGSEAIKAMLVLRAGNFLIDPNPERIPQRAISRGFRELMRE